MNLRTITLSLAISLFNTACYDNLGSANGGNNNDAEETDGTDSDTGLSDDTGDTDDTGISDYDSDGFAADEDCDETDPDINPDADEICDGIDNDCDGYVDEGCDDGGNTGDDSSDDTEYVDEDGDGATTRIDCDDSDATVYPGAEEIEDDGIDQDCDGYDQTSDGDDTDLDSDNDGWAYYNDCNDEDPDVWDDCDDEDDTGTDTGDTGSDDDSDIDADGDGWTEDVDCDDSDDEVGDSITWYEDSDSDGYGDPDQTLEQCDQPTGYVSDDTDCDDSDASINPDADEIFDDGIDNDCDGEENNGVLIYIGATYDASRDLALNVWSWTDGSDMTDNAWSASESVESDTFVELSLSEDDYDANCGVRFNVTVDSNDAWACENAGLNDDFEFEVWTDVTGWLDESDLDTDDHIWIADDGTGSCSLYVQFDSASDCTPVNDE